MLLHNSPFPEFGFPVVVLRLDKEVEDAIQGLWVHVRQIVSCHQSHEKTCNANSNLRNAIKKLKKSVKKRKMRVMVSDKGRWVRSDYNRTGPSDYSTTFA